MDDNPEKINEQRFKANVKVARDHGSVQVSAPTYILLDFATQR
jgi:hypothetical protein